MKYSVNIYTIFMKFRRKPPASLPKNVEKFYCYHRN